MHCFAFAGCMFCTVLSVLTYSTTNHSSTLSLSLQAFGFPMVVCHVDGKPAAFFGSDRFELLAHCIGQKYLLNIYSRKHSSVVMGSLY